MRAAASGREPPWCWCCGASLIESTREAALGYRAPGRVRVRDCTHGRWRVLGQRPRRDRPAPGSGSLTLSADPGLLGMLCHSRHRPGAQATLSGAFLGCLRPDARSQWRGSGGAEWCSKTRDGLLSRVRFGHRPPRLGYEGSFEPSRSTYHVKVRVSTISHVTVVS
jgi:hypothetical protein